jgi:hypothetical protein
MNRCEAVKRLRELRTFCAAMCEDEFESRFTDLCQKDVDALDYAISFLEKFY